MEKAPKRFEIQPDEFAQERVSGIRSAIEALQSSYPEIVGCTLYGSLSKGRSRPESDIDMHVFLDVPKACVAQGMLEEEWHEYVSVENIDRSKNEQLDITGLHPDTRLDHTLYKPYKDIVVAELRKYVPELTDEQVKNVSIRPMNMEYIDEVCDTLEQSWKAATQYASEVDALHATGHGDVTVEQLRSMPSWIEQLILPPDLLYQMFHLGVGVGIRPYRDRLLERLYAMGDEGKYIWEVIGTGLERWELALSRGGEQGRVQYPQTLAVAIKKYATTELKEKLGLVQHA